MTLKTNARLTGTILLLYIATGITSLVLMGQVTDGAEGTAEKLASIAEHAFQVRVNILLDLLCAAYAIILAVTFYALTRHQDADLAMLSLCCRFSEGLIIALGPIISLGQLSVATMIAPASGTEIASSNALGVMAIKIGDWSGIITAICFSAGSMIYSYLFLRSRSIPAPLAWLGLLASILLVVILPLRLAGFIEGSLINFIWYPMLVFEVALALWLIIKGVTIPATR